MPSKHAGTPMSLRLNAQQLALLERLAPKYGGKKEALWAGLKALEHGAVDPSPEVALRVLGEVVAAAGRPKRKKPK